MNIVADFSKFIGFTNGDGQSIRCRLDLQGQMSDSEGLNGVGMWTPFPCFIADVVYSSELCRHERKGMHLFC